MQESLQRKVRPCKRPVEGFSSSASSALGPRASDVDGAQVLEPDADALLGATQHDLDRVSALDHRPHDRAALAVEGGTAQVMQLHLAAYRHAAVVVHRSGRLERAAAAPRRRLACGGCGRTSNIRRVAE